MDDGGLHAWLAGAEGALVVLDRAARVAWVNDRAAALVGRPRKALAGAPWIDLCLPEPARAEVRGAWALLMSGEGEVAWTHETPLLHADGRLVAMAWTTTLLRGPGGPTGALSVGHPLPDAPGRARPRSALQRRAETASRRAAVYQGLFDQTPVGFLVHGTDGEISLANARAGELLAEAPEALQGRSLLALVAPDPAERARAAELLRRFAAGEPVAGEVLALRRADGAVRRVRVDVMPIRDADGALVEGRTSLIDVTPEHEADERARLFAAIVDAMPVGVAVIAQDDPGDAASFRFVARNAAAARLAGAPGEDWTGRRLADAAPAAIEAGLHEVYAAVAERGEARRLGELTFTWPDGELACLLTDVFPLPGRRVGVAVQDLSDRRRAELALEARTRELQRSNADLEQFASVASHDLQEPLRKIVAFGRRLEERLGEGLDATSGDWLRRMLDAAARMQGLIEGLLAYARAGLGAAPADAVPLDGVLAAVATVLDHAIEGSGARLRVGPLPVVRGSRVALQQIFQNLVGNALKYHAPGEAPDVTVEGRVLPGGALAEIVVRDRGIGFAAADAEAIFAPFHRLHGRSAYAGAGVGLAICRRLAERLGGTLAAEGRPGEGAAFTLRLPAA